MRTTLAGLSALTLTLAFAPAAGMAPRAATDEVFYYKPPAVFVQTEYQPGVPPEMYFDGKILGDVLDEPYSAYTAGPGGRAWAAASVNQFDAGALGGTAGYPMATATAWAFQEFMIPASTPQEMLKVNLGSKLGPTSTKGFKGVLATPGPISLENPNGAALRIRVYPAPANPPTVTLDGNKVIDYVFPDWPVGAMGYVFEAYAFVTTWWDAPEYEGGPPVQKSHWEYTTILNGETVGDSGAGDAKSMSLVTFPTITVRRGVRYVIEILAQAGPKSLAVIDPVVEPHPDNPDIVIQYPNLAVDPNPQPIMRGMTVAELEALGIDVQPLIDLGFIEDPGDDTTAPSTLASATPKLNSKSGNKPPVTVTLTATDNPGGSGIKEVHYSLEGATTGSLIVPGGSATVTISAAGTTTLSYFAVDNAGNEETAKTVTVRIRPYR